MIPRTITSHTRLRTTALLALVAAFSGSAAFAKLSIERTTCEYEPAPLGLDAAHPRLAWTLKGTERGEVQAAYRVLVATKPAALATEHGDVWDSGKIDSAESTQISYAGKALASGATYYWSVQVWNKAGDASEWSKPAQWTTGLLGKDAWKAQWLAAPFAVYDMTIKRAAWLWVDTSTNNAAELTQVPPGFSGAFTLNFEAPAADQIATAFVTLAAQPTAEAWLNGKPLGDYKWPLAGVNDVKSLLKSGQNTLAVKVTNTSNTVMATTFAARVRIDQVDGKRVDWLSSTTWHAAEKVSGDDWKLNGLPGKTLAQMVGDPKKNPWTGKVKMPELPLPLFRKEFDLSKPIKRALVHVSGLGHYDLYLNGKKVGDHKLDPAWSEYETTVYYNTFDITKRLNEGKNAFGIMLGKGFFDSTGDRRIYNTSNDYNLRFILQAEVEYEDGTRETIASDPTWRAAAGPVTHAAIMGGSDYDARRDQPGWGRPNFDDAAWTPAVPSASPGGELHTPISPPLTVQQVFSDPKVDEPQPGVFVYDFGQNAASVPLVTLHGKAGQVVRLAPAEQRQGQAPRTNNGKGRVNQQSIGRPHYYEYTLRGDGQEVWEPQFAYCGYQYLELTGAVPRGEPNPQDLPVIDKMESQHVRAEVPSAGTFKCDKSELNDIFRIIDWSVRNNMYHVLTDCPHREKLGWLEQTYLMATGVSRTYDVSRYYDKLSKDMADSQAADGEIFTVAPHYAKFAGGFGYSPEWGACGVHLPWLLYKWYGDKQVLAERFDCMHRYVDYMEATSTDLIALAGLGDWYDYGHGKPVGPSQFTPKDLTATTTFLECTNIVARAAEALGKTKETEHYKQLAERIKTKLNATWLKGDQYANTGSPQCANAMALVAGAVPDDKREALVNAIVADLEKRDYQQTAGDIGFHYLLQALSDAGRNDVIMKIVERRELGGYRFIVDHGWTAMPEAWDANTAASMDHLMLGHIEQWYYEQLMGLRQINEDAGFKNIVIAPVLVGDLKWVEGYYDSPQGRIAVRWERTASKFTLDVTIPVGTQAGVVLPTSAANTITESGKKLEDIKGVIVGEIDDKTTTLSVESGQYHFECRLDAPKEK